MVSGLGTLAEIQAGMYKSVQRGKLAVTKTDPVICHITCYILYVTCYVLYTKSYILY